MYTFDFKWFKKPPWVINIKFYVIITDMFHKYRMRRPKEFCKNGVLDSFTNSARKYRNLLLKKYQDTG